MKETLLRGRATLPFSLSKLHPRHWSLATQMVVVMASLAAVVITLISLLTAHVAQQQIIRDVSRSQEAQALHLSNVTVLFLRDKVGQLEVLALSDPIREGIVAQNRAYSGSQQDILKEIERYDSRWISASDEDPLVLQVIGPDTNRASAALNTFLARFPDHSEVFVTDRYGGTVAATDRLTDYQQSDERWWQSAWNEGNGAIYISPPTYDKSADVTALLIAIPLRDSTGEPIGVLRSTLAVDELYAFIETTAPEGTGHAMLVNGDGDILFDTLGNPGPSGGATVSQDLSEVITGDGTGSLITDDVTGEPAIFGYAQVRARTEDRVNDYEDEIAPSLANLNWTIAVRQPTRVALKPVQDFRTTMWFVGALAFLLFALASIKLSHSITTPLQELDAATRRIAAGTLDAPLDLHGSRELGQLAASFERMASRLEATITRMKEEIEERKNAEEQLRHNAFYDELTGLPNRALFKDRVERSVVRARRQGSYLFAVLYIDLDNFKIVNDSLGREAGNEVLRQVGERAQVVLRSGDTVARIGEDEYALLLDDIPDISAAVRIAERLQAELTKPFEVDGNELFVTASTGIALHSPEVVDAETLLRDAAMAMNRAKSHGRARYSISDPDMHTQARERLELETDLRQAIEAGELEVHYQPIVSLGDRSIVGFEALVRWNRAGGDPVSPAVFVPIAEQADLIFPLDAWVLRESCRQLGEWQRLLPNGRSLSMAVNLSANDFLEPELVEIVRAALDENGLGPESLKLEITESTLLDMPRMANSVLPGLQDLGVRLNLDDFGTGYSSLSYLNQLPIDALKIDGSFVAGLEAQGQDLEIVRTIMNMATGLGLGVVAEGVETQGQTQMLLSLDCPQAQGYYFSRPVAPQQATTLVEAGRLPAEV